MEMIRTERLILRPFRTSDTNDLYEYLSDMETVKFEPYDPMTFDQVREELQRRISSDEMIAVEMKSTGKLIGNLYLGYREFNTREIGYVFNRTYWGKGFAKEAAGAIIGKAFDEGVHRIYAECDPLNPNSWHLLESLGFVREAHFRKNVYFHMDGDMPIWKDTYVYSLLNENRRPQK